jgi:hypothetical protein
MNHTCKVLKSDIELFAAALSQARVVKPLSEDMVEVAQRLFILHYKEECSRRWQ